MIITNIVYGCVLVVHFTSAIPIGETLHEIPLVLSPDSHLTSTRLFALGMIAAVNAALLIEERKRAISKKYPPSLILLLAIIAILGGLSFGFYVGLS